VTLCAVRPALGVRSWLLNDQLEFANTELPIALDRVNRCAYRKTDSDGVRLWTAAAPLWAGMVGRAEDCD